MRSASARFAALLMTAAVLTANAADGPDTDPDTGLAIAPGWELVRAHCGACHSYRLITAQRGDAGFWRDTIDWMQRTQNLWKLPDDQEQVIVDYLAGAYAGSDWGRRPPLSPRLLPSASNR